MIGFSFHLPFRDRLRLLLLLLVGIIASVAGFLFTRDAHRRQVEAQFKAAAGERIEGVVRGLRNGFEDITVLRNFFEASDEITRAEFDTFTTPLHAWHPFIQAYQWLPKVTDSNRAALEAEGRRFQRNFRFFDRPVQGQISEMPMGAPFHGIQYVVPYAGNEVTLGYCAEALATRQETLARALATGAPTASGGFRLIQETGNQAGLLVMVPVRGKYGQPLGVVQGVFRTGDLVQKSVAFLQPQGVSIRLFDATDPGKPLLLHEEPSALPAVGREQEEGLQAARTFELAGRRWLVSVTPDGGHFTLGAPWRAWIVLLTGLSFTILLAGYVGNLLAGEAMVRDQVEARTRELALETENHLRDAQALQESEARFRQLIEVMGEGMWVMDPEGRTTFVNRHMADMLGYEPSEMVGRSLLDFMKAADVPQMQRNLAERRQGLGGQYDFRFLRKDGGEVLTMVTGTPVVGDEGQVVSILGVVRDVTARRRQEQAQLQSQKLESLGVLAGGIAHDFNNLLTAILGNINLAQLSLPTVSPASLYLENMERAVQRAASLTRQMLAYSGRGHFLMVALDLNATVQEVSHLLGVSISKKVALRFQLQEGLPVLMAEASQIQQVVMNLVTNASEAIGDEAGIVSIRTGVRVYDAPDLAREFPGQSIQPGTFLTLEVSDTGHGMAPEVQARVFEPFFTTKFTGRGLGLSAMQGIVRGHQGGIRLYSEPGQGTTFKLIFPAGLGEVAETPVADEVEDWKGQGTILVVDDEEGVRTVAEHLLRSMGFEVILACDGLEALERFRESADSIRAVLMDLTMPRLNGLEAFRELRLLDPGCRVVLTSGYNEQEAVQDFVGKGLAGFVQKPFLRADLQRAMRLAVEG